jgi:hypothetical protein
VTLPGDVLSGDELLGRKKAPTFLARTTASLGIYRRGVEKRGVHAHRADELDSSRQAAHDLTTSVLGIADENHGAVPWEPRVDLFYHFSRQLGSLAVLLLGTLLLRAIQAESYWNGHPAIFVPRCLNADANNDPIVSEGKNFTRDLPRP